MQHALHLKPTAQLASVHQCFSLALLNANVQQVNINRVIVVQHVIQRVTPVSLHQQIAQLVKQGLTEH